MESLVGYVLGFGGGFLIAVIVFILYERQNKQLKLLLEFTQRQLNSCLSKMMAVDYEKLAEADIQARALGQAAWLQAQNVAMPELSDLDAFNPDDFMVGKNAK